MNLLALPAASAYLSALAMAVGVAVAAPPPPSINTNLCAQLQPIIARHFEYLDRLAEADKTLGIWNKEKANLQDAEKIAPYACEEYLRAVAEKVENAALMHAVVEAGK